MKEERPMKKVALRLYESDLDWLRETYKYTLGYNRAIRQIIARHVRREREKESRAIDNLEVELEDLGG